MLVAINFHPVGYKPSPLGGKVFSICPSPAKIAQYLKGKSLYRLQREFPALQKRYWGRHLWGRGYFCATVGAITEEQIKQYIANQTEELKSFNVWDEAEQTSEEKQKLESDSSENL